MMEDIDKFVELDRLNMAPIIEAAGGRFDPDFRRQKIVQERERGALFLSALRDGEVVAYIEYMPGADDVWNVMSIQIHPLCQNGTILCDLLATAWKDLSVSRARTVRSSVHTTNNPSLRLHRKLGFLKTGEMNDRILFETDAQSLCERLERFGKRRKKANNAMHADADKPRR
jgi:ribosomal protein S18 acetylase RimI-like enzyme